MFREKKKKKLCEYYGFFISLYSEKLFSVRFMRKARKVKKNKASCVMLDIFFDK